MIGVDRNVDFRYVAGFPTVEQALRNGTRVVRCVSLPDMEVQAARYLAAGIRVFAVYTGESDAAGRYVMQACSALQIGNEPEFAMKGPASWPTGTADDMINVWNYVANELVPPVHPQGLPLIGPSIWCQDYDKWQQIANWLPGLSAAGCHVYPGPSGQTVGAVRLALKYYRAVRPDLPLLCMEWMARQPNVLAIARAIDSYCDVRLWYGPGTPGHELEGTPEYGILALVGP